MGRHNIFSTSAPRPSRIRFAVSRAAAITVVLAVIAWVSLSILFNSSEPTEQLLSVETEQEQLGAPPSTPPPEPDTAQTLTVHVVGEVNRPGVYELPSGSRINDAIQAAGGMNSEARPELLNLASVLVDGQQIFLPGPQDAGIPPGFAPAGSAQPSQSGQPADGLININQADAETLTRLPGIGPALAGRIIDFREANGPFTSVEELDEVTGIGPVLVGKLQDLVQVP